MIALCQYCHNPISDEEMAAPDIDPIHAIGLGYGKGFAHNKCHKEAIKK